MEKMGLREILSSLLSLMESRHSWVGREESTPYLFCLLQAHIYAVFVLCILSKPGSRYSIDQAKVCALCALSLGLSDLIYWDPGQLGSCQFMEILASLKSFYHGLVLGEPGHDSKLNAREISFD